MSLPEPIIALLASFQPIFTTPTWQKAMVLLAGTLLARGRRTVTIALRQMGLEDSPHFSKYHHVLNRARWSSLQLSRCLLNLLVKTFVQAGGVMEIVIDETLERDKESISANEAITTIVAVRPMSISTSVVGYGGSA